MHRHCLAALSTDGFADVAIRRGLTAQYTHTYTHIHTQTVHKFISKLLVHLVSFFTPGRLFQQKGSTSHTHTHTQTVHKSVHKSSVHLLFFKHTSRLFQQKGLTAHTQTVHNPHTSRRCAFFPLTPGRPCRRMGRSPSPA